jgi:hypothetical protein
MAPLSIVYGLCRHPRIPAGEKDWSQVELGGGLFDNTVAIGVVQRVLALDKFK